jgi:long-chain acyl-CoA synthetase
MDAVLITGATGFVGGEVLSRYVERTDRPIYALVRAKGQADAERRVREALAYILPPDADTTRVIAVPGDVERDDLGLDPALRDELAENVADIIHSAASVSFSLPLARSREINVGGTRHVLEFAGRCRDHGGLHRLSYVSTAYVAGTHEGEFGEDQLDVGQAFRNGYERSKFEAEQLVRAWPGRLPIQILRPSIIVGERGSGWTASFNVLYAPLKTFARGALHVLPGRSSSPVDVVPVDYVADAVFELANGEPADDRTYHLVAGAQATTLGDLVQIASRRLDRRRPLLISPERYRRYLHPLLVKTSRGRRRQALERTEVFFPYFSARVRFQNDRARGRLEPAGVRMTPIEGYFDRLVDFAVRARWGRVAIGRSQARM